ncbi:MAG: TIGR02757 family protein [Lentisphaerae bacterium]|nr:TIGR02757 family protein [Lentisphaerota bacterium]
MIDPDALERLYLAYNKRRYVSPDPLQFLYNYKEPADREVVGLVAASLAYGRVAQILRSVDNALTRLDGKPHLTLISSSPRELERRAAGFRHRFTSDSDLASLFKGIRSVLLAHGSLKSCFLAGLAEKDKTVIPALERFRARFDCPAAHVLPSAAGAGKRLHLFLRWMVRHDDVDPGGWEEAGAHRLLIPLDTHMSQFGREFHLTRMKTSGRKMAEQITDGFRAIRPDDPVRYDFVITRFGIRSDMNQSERAALGSFPARP